MNTICPKCGNIEPTDQYAILQGDTDECAECGADMRNAEIWSDADINAAHQQQQKTQLDTMLELRDTLMDETRRGTN